MNPGLPALRQATTASRLGPFASDGVNGLDDVDDDRNVPDAAHSDALPAELTAAIKRTQAIDGLMDVEQVRIERLAHWFWQRRGCPVGSPEDDWFRAEHELRIVRRTTWLPLYAFGIERRTQ